MHHIFRLKQDYREFSLLGKIRHALRYVGSLGDYKTTFKVIKQVITTGCVESDALKTVQRTESLQIRSLHLGKKNYWE